MKPNLDVSPSSASTYSICFLNSYVGNKEFSHFYKNDRLRIIYRLKAHPCCSISILNVHADLCFTPHKNSFGLILKFPGFAVPSFNNMQVSLC